MASENTDVPTVHAITADLAQEKIREIERQFNAQAEAWNRQEKAMLDQQELLVQAMAELNAKLDASERRNECVTFFL